MVTDSYAMIFETDDLVTDLKHLQKLDIFDPSNIKSQPELYAKTSEKVLS